MYTRQITIMIPQMIITLLTQLIFFIFSYEDIKKPQEN
jgi:hypothetical protein